MAMTCSLRSAGITPASTLLRGSPPLTGASVTFGLAVGAACALYGVFIVKRFDCGDLSFSLYRSVSLFDLESRFFAPTRSIARPARAGAVKVGRRSNLASYWEPVWPPSFTLPMSALLAGFSAENSRNPVYVSRPTHGGVAPWRFLRACCAKFSKHISVASGTKTSWLQSPLRDSIPHRRRGVRFCRILQPMAADNGCGA